LTDPILSIRALRKTYGTGVDALKSVDLDIRRGEIFALLGPNGAGKTTLINIVCGIVTASSGEVLVDGRDWRSNFRYARERIGLVPQELTTEAFESVWNTVSFSRGLFGRPRNDAYIEDILKRLSLWDKRKSEMRFLSGGMKRRAMIAKALAHEPALLFLDEPTAGVDVELRRDMWELVRKLRAGGTTIILTTHYIEEAEEMADRVGVISRGELVAVDEKQDLMAKMGRKTLDIVLAEALDAVPPGLSDWSLELHDDGRLLRYQFDSHAERTGIASLMRRLADLGIGYKDLSTHQSSLEDIFVELVHGGGQGTVPGQGLSLSSEAKEP
jgi:ABC-2 type transport system ATP-binding protein